MKQYSTKKAYTRFCVILSLIYHMKKNNIPFFSLQRDVKTSLKDNSNKKILGYKLEVDHFTVNKTQALTLSTDMTEAEKQFLCETCMLLHH